MNQLIMILPLASPSQLRETIKRTGLGAPKSVTLIYLADMGQLE